MSEPPVPCAYRICKPFAASPACSSWDSTSPNGNYTAVSHPQSTLPAQSNTSAMLAWTYSLFFRASLSPGSPMRGWASDPSLSDFYSAAAGGSFRSIGSAGDWSFWPTSTSSAYRGYQRGDG